MNLKYGARICTKTLRHEETRRILCDFYVFLVTLWLIEIQLPFKASNIFFSEASKSSNVDLERK
jgi:hypothetical protein